MRSIPALMAPPPARDNPLTRSVAGLVGLAFLVAVQLACLGSLPWTLARVGGSAADPGAGTARYNFGLPGAARLPPAWWPKSDDQTRALNALVDPAEVDRIAARHGMPAEEAVGATSGPAAAELRRHWPRPFLGTDPLGRSLFVRLLTGGGVSLGIGIAAAALSVFIGTLYGTLAAYIGGKTDAVMMRIVDVLYGLPYILLVVLLAVASDAAIDEWIARTHRRAAWAESMALTVSRTHLGARAGEAEREAFLAGPTSEAGPLLAGIARRVLGAAWQRDHDMARREAQRRDRAIERARTDAERARAAARTVPEVPAALPTADEAAAIVAGEATVRGLLERLAAAEVRPREVGAGRRALFDVVVLLVAIGGVSWLTMARVIRGQVLSLKAQPFMEAARALGVPFHRQLLRHLLPNLLGPIIVYATLTVPQAVLQESFLSFLGIGVKPPLPSWGNLAADGLAELNSYKSHWWLLLFPCLMLAATLLALNFVGEGLREAFDPRRARR